MSIAAVPKYMGQDFSTASPGLRFGMYLKLWEGAAWTKVKQPSLADATRLNDNDRKTMTALLARQQAAFEAVPVESARLRLDALATAPFTTGLGNEHPLENGFAFLNPYGLPYLPGSGVKGVLRQAARELVSGEWGDRHGWCKDERYPLMRGEGEQRKDVLDKNRKPVRLSMLDVLFGRESKDGDSEHLRGVLGFWDVIPQIAGNHLAVEIMTPHQSHYYQKGDSPHDSGQPNPISFLSVPPGSGFAFHVVCDRDRLARLAPALAEGDLWKGLLSAAFAHAFAWLGFGAKTAVGYGAMHIDVAKEDTREQARLAVANEAQRAALSEAQRAVQDFIGHMQTRHQQLRGGKDRPNTASHQSAQKFAKAALESSDWSPEEKRAAADAIEAWLPKVVQVEMKDECKKLKLRQLRGEP